jgi:glucose/mannose-6-phosphate isomerase
MSINCKKLAITTGGKLKNLAESVQVPVFLVEPKYQPRAALGYSFISLTAFLRNLGFLKGITIDIKTIKQLLESLLSEDLNETVPTSSNPAKQLALNLYGKIPVVYGAEALSGVARRWKTQINENSKSWGFYETFPELNHNAVVGYQIPQKPAMETYVVLLLNCPSLHPRILTRYSITGDILEQNLIKHQVVNSRGEELLSQMMSLIYIGDWTSYYLAILNGIDPTPVSSIDYLKKQLENTK